MSTAETFEVTDLCVYDEALAAWDAGMSVVRIRDNGKKKIIAEYRGNHHPDGRKKYEWGHYAIERADRDTVNDWFKDGHPGIGVICGAVSGGLEMFEFEGEAAAEGMFDQFIGLLEDNGLLDLWDRISAGWSESTPSGGIHVYYRVAWAGEEVAGNEKLATRPHPDDPRKVQTLVETRGEGGFSVIAPSHGKVSSVPGKAWRRWSGGPATVVTISPTERAALHALSRTFHVEPERPQAPKRPVRDTPIEGGGWMDKVVHDLNQRPWSEVLGRYGWTYSHSEGDEDYWCRPGKTKAEGHSATTNAKGTDRLIVFSSSTPFEPYDGGQAPSYDRLDVIATYDHHGDRVAAAKDLDPNAREDWIEEQRKSDRRFLKSVPGYRASDWDEDEDDEDNEDTAVDDHADELDDNNAPDEEQASEEQAEQTDDLCPHLPDEFWSARPAFQHIRQAAWSKGIAADGLFGAILARAAYKADWQVVLPDIIGSYQSLNLLVGLVGGSGDGKGSSLNVAERLMPGIPVSDPKAVEVTAGSGEGIPRSFYEQVPVEDENGNPTKQREWKQIRRHVYLRIDEGEVTQAISQRRGSTFWVVMRSVYSGEGLGFNNADADRRFPVERLGYRMSAAIAIQPTIAAGLLEDKDGGTPQRFLWFGLTDANMTINPDDLPDFPGQIAWQPPRYDSNGTELVCGYNLGVINVAPEIRKEILGAKLLHTAGRKRRKEMDSHRNLTKLKVAALLGMLDRRLNVTLEDWALADTILSTSDAVRDWTYRQVDTSAILRQLRADERQGQRQVTVNQMAAAAHATAVRVGKVIARHVHTKHADGSACKAKCLKNAVGSRDSDNLGIGRDHAIVAGWVEVNHKGWLIPGDSVPTAPKAEGGK